MSRLVLYDLENAGSRRGDQIPELDPEASTVVVVAVSTGGLAVLGREQERDYTFEDLLADAGATARTIWPETTRFALEVALVLSMPEAADLALARLVREAGTRETAGGFDEIALVTRDRGLRDDIDACIREAGCGWRESEPTPEGWWRWHCPPLGDALERIFLPSGSIQAQPRNAAGPTVVLDSQESVRDWVTTPVQVASTLAELTRQVEERPERLTQIGITRTSTRSVARLVELATGQQPTLLGTVPDDGLEVVGPGALPAAGARRIRIEEASLPHGAVRLEWGGPRTTATVRTRLWSKLLRGLTAGAHPPMRGDGSIDDGKLLRGRCHDGQQVRVSFYRLGRQGKVACAIETEPRLAPAAWWYRAGSPTAKMYVETDRLIGRGPSLGEVSARAVVGNGEVRLVALEPTGALTLLDRVPQSFLGCATDERGKRFAVLSTRGPLERGARIHATPIAGVLEPLPRAAGLRPIWKVLQRFPILVVE